jgi:ABC-2 type transport system ATP-binding protein
MGQALNTRWDASLARQRVLEAGLDPRQRAGRLSGGQRAQLALALAVARRPGLLLLDEPAASLDPLARREFLDSVTRAADASAEGMTVVLSSHLIADLERTCGYLIVLVASQVRLAGPVETLLAGPPRCASLDDLVVSCLREVPR